MAREIQPRPFVAAHAEGHLVVDVREQFEYMAGHVPGSVLIPLGELPQRVNELPTSGQIYVICATGNRSLAGADFLAAKGLDAYSVAGGMFAWEAAGNPVVVGANAT